MVIYKKEQNFIKLSSYPLIIGFGSFFLFLIFNYYYFFLENNIDKTGFYITNFVLFTFFSIQQKKVVYINKQKNIIKIKKQFPFWRKYKEIKISNIEKTDWVQGKGSGLAKGSNIAFYTDNKEVEPIIVNDISSKIKKKTLILKEIKHYLGK